MRGLDAARRLRAVEASVWPEELTGALDDPSPEVVRAAIRRLVDLKGDGAMAALRARALDTDLALVADFVKALERIGDSSVGTIAINALDDRRLSRRLAAIRAIAALPDDGRAVEALRGVLDDDVAGVRAAALDALAHVGGNVSVGTANDCARLLSDPVPLVRVAAVRALIRLVAHPGPMLAPAACDQDRTVRLAVAQRAASLPERAARALLEDPELRVREAAARAAGMREAGALAVLLVDDPARDVRRAVAHALGEMRDERVADLLVPGLEDRDALVRAAVLHELEHLLTRQGIVRRLCNELGGERAERRRASVYALAHLDAREASHEIASVASDPDPEVRLALVQSVDALFDEPAPVVDYLANDSDEAVRHATEMWRLRPRAKP
ncbi:MAG TPA: HEAT repeat domain-containing protein [Solirubrobacteraceae bacterium]|nr:HEAT repeat domain-containing protein [Solirubrobacteraceae bacterium]